MTFIHDEDDKDDDDSQWRALAAQLPGQNVFLDPDHMATAPYYDLRDARRGIQNQMQEGLYCASDENADLLQTQLENLKTPNQNLSDLQDLYHIRQVMRPPVRRRYPYNENCGKKLEKAHVRQPIIYANCWQMSSASVRDGSDSDNDSAELIDTSSC
ncbi:uncharacterized protein BKA78DRAFT_356256 [Phyllosticta capitalensis]|uniref:uncharacterized protein n=1 Tax=Phyllosticta capitalensis TaxID=121624 RepID=UPI00312EBF53